MHARGFTDKGITAVCPCTVKICLTNCQYIHCWSASGGGSCLLMQKGFQIKDPKTHMNADPQFSDLLKQSWHHQWHANFTKVLEAHDSLKRSLFFTTRAFRVFKNYLRLKFGHWVGIASMYKDISDQCQQSGTVFGRVTCLCAGSLFSVNLLHSLASRFLQRTALGHGLWCRFRLRFVGLGNHRGDLHVAALDLLLHVREIGCRDVKLCVQLHVHQMKSHLAPQCCHGLVLPDLPHASTQSNKWGNEMKQTP